MRFYYDPDTIHVWNEVKVCSLVSDWSASGIIIFCSVSGVRIRFLMSYCLTSCIDYNLLFWSRFFYTFVHPSLRHRTDLLLHLFGNTRHCHSFVFSLVHYWTKLLLFDSYSSVLYLSSRISCICTCFHLQ